MRIHTDDQKAAFYADLIALINKHSLENESDTPDFILADYLMACLAAFNQSINDRERWYKKERETE